MSTAWERVLLSHGTDNDLEALAAACLTALRVWKWEEDTAFSSIASLDSTVSASTSTSTSRLSVADAEKVLRRRRWSHALGRIMRSIAFVQRVRGLSWSQSSIRHSHSPLEPTDSDAADDDEDDDEDEVDDEAAITTSSSSDESHHCRHESEAAASDASSVAFERARRRPVVAGRWRQQVLRPLVWTSGSPIVAWPRAEWPSGPRGPLLSTKPQRFRRRAAKRSRRSQRSPSQSSVEDEDAADMSELVRLLERCV